MNLQVVILLFGSLLVCVAMSVPICFSLMICSLSLIIGFKIVSLSAIPAALYNSIDSFALTAIPFFIFSASIMDRGNLMQSIINICKNQFRKFYGGLGMAIMATSAVFAAMCGSSVSSAAAMGKVGIPMMKDEGYPEDFSGAAIAAGGTMGILIPPSLTMVLICSLIGENVSTMFVAGILPGIIQTVLLCILIGYIAKKHKYGKVGEKVEVSRQDRIRGMWAAGTPVIILGGIYTGVFTATEAAAVSALYAMLVVVFIYREIGFKEIMHIAYESAKLIGNILFILAGATLFGVVLNYSGLPQAVVSLITSNTLPVWVFYLASFFIMLILGMLLDGNAMVAIVVPLVWPVVEYYGINPIQFSIFMVCCVELGTLTPPVGMNLFVTSTIAKQPIDRVAVRLAPFYLLMVLLIILVLLFPAISLTLPALMRG